MSSDRAILEPLFLESVAAFQEAGLDRVKRVRLVVTSDAHDSARHFAACRTDGRQILIAPEATKLDVDTVAAIFCHELGHAADYLYPGRYLLIGEELTEWHHPDWAPGAPDPHPREAHNRMRQWEHRDDDNVERTADAIAEHIIGRPIYYGGSCILQTFDPRGAVYPRPAGVR